MTLSNHTDPEKRVDDQAAQEPCQVTGEHNYSSRSTSSKHRIWIRICSMCKGFDAKDLDEQVDRLLEEERVGADAAARINELGQMLGMYVPVDAYIRNRMTELKAHYKETS